MDVVAYGRSEQEQFAFSGKRAFAYIPDKVVFLVSGAFYERTNSSGDYIELKSFKILVVLEKLFKISVKSKPVEDLV